MSAFSARDDSNASCATKACGQIANRHNVTHCRQLRKAFAMTTPLQDYVSSRTLLNRSCATSGMGRLVLGRRRWELLEHLVQGIVDFLRVLIRIVAERIGCRAEPKQLLGFGIANIQ